MSRDSRAIRKKTIINFNYISSKNFDLDNRQLSEKIIDSWLIKIRLEISYPIEKFTSIPHKTGEKQYFEQMLQKTDPRIQETLNYL